MEIRYGVDLEQLRQSFPPPPKFFDAGIRTATIVFGALLVAAAVAFVFHIASPVQYPTLDIVGWMALITAALGTGLTFGFGRGSHRKILEQREQRIQNTLKSVHCSEPGARSVAVSDTGLKIACRCGTVERPWQQVVGVQENPSFLNIATRMESVAVPLKAFASDAQRTEFRTAILDRIGKPAIVGGIRAEFRYEPSDYKRGRAVLHRKISGWRRYARLYPVAIALWLVYQTWVDRPEWRGMIVAGAVPALILLTYWLLSRPARGAKAPSWPVVVTCGAEGLRVQQPNNDLSLQWSDFQKFIDDRDYWLLYGGRAGLWVLPKRAFDAAQNAAIGDLLRAKLQAV